MNATFDRAEMLRCLGRFPKRRSRTPTGLRVIAARNGLVLLSHGQRDFVPALVLQSATFTTPLKFFTTAVTTFRHATLTLQADDQYFRLGELKFRLVDYRRTEEVTFETLTSAGPD